MNFKEIEKAGFRSWPALEESEVEGIVLRFSNGYTKRANSVNLLQEQKVNFEVLVNRYEEYFQEKDLPCIFRLPSFSENQELDSYLEGKGYRYMDRSLVLYRSIENSGFDDIEIIEKSSNDWMDSYCEINEIETDNHTTHLEMIKRIEDRTLFAVLKEDGVEIACGLGVISNGYFGLFDISTKMSVRKKGYGTKLLNGMLYWAEKKGASNSYLQVVADNHVAIKLYEKLGYQRGYEYWYRIRD